jgi:phage terminase large subunit GpA-like protein
MDHTGFDNLRYQEYPNKFIDDVYGKYDPNSTIFVCHLCDKPWTFEEKNQNIINGKKHGFTDHTGNFSKGWHPLKPQVSDVFGFSFSELLSPFDGSHFTELAKAEIVAKKELEIGNELLMKSYVNNKKGQPFASGVSSMEVEEMRLYRRNYAENIVPMEGLVLTMGVDFQDNRYARVIRAWGRNGVSWLISWKEVFGDIRNKDDDVWKELEHEIITPITHSSGKDIYISYTSLDAADNTELVYTFSQNMLEYSGVSVLACKGVRDLRYSEDDIYKEPGQFDVDTAKKARKTLAERMGVTVYNVGAHQAHDEILRRIMLTKLAHEEEVRSGSNTQYKSDLFYWNATEYGMYEEQMVSCRKLIEQDRSGNARSIYKLIPGKRKEAMDCEKLALHASRAMGLHNYTNSHWQNLERYFS